MSFASFLVCEKSGKWGAEFRRHASALDRRVHEVRSLDEAREELLLARASFLAVEVDCRSLVKTWEFLAYLWGERRQARTLILADPEILPWTRDLREVGAVDVIYSWRQIPRILSLITRHLAMYPSRDRSFRQQIEDRLPWRDDDLPTI